MPLEDWDDSPEPQDLLRLASSASACDWLALGDADLFKHPAKLLAQMHRAMQYPLRERVPGSPMLFRRQPLLMRERLPSGYFDG